MSTLLAALLALLPWEAAAACSLPQGFEPFPIEAGAAGPVPAKPEVRPGRIVRGFDDGRPDSCSGFASIEILLEDDAEPAMLGYEFELVAGALPQPFLPDRPVRPVRIGGSGRVFVFYWPESAANAERHELLDATLAVRAVSRSGRRSVATRIRLFHPGGVAG